jgi:hypothetical protein
MSRGTYIYVTTVPYGDRGAFTYTGSGVSVVSSVGMTPLRAFPQSNIIRFFPTTSQRTFPRT